MQNVTGVTMPTERRPTGTRETGRAATCPVHTWCDVNHADEHEGADCHYSAAITVGPVNLRLDTGTDGRTTLELVTAHADGDNLNLDQFDALMARLNDLRPTLAAATLPVGVR